MVNQQIYLPMIPDSAPIVINISQYDYDAADYNGRLFFNLISNGVAYDMDGATAVFQGEKPDGTTFAYPATIVNESVVRVNVRQQMTAAAGRVVCNLVLNNNDGQIGSFNIWLEVQPASTSGGDPSQTDIPALIAQAHEYADQAEQALINIQAYSANPPYIGANGNWFVWDVVNSQYTDTGVYAAGIEGNLWYSGTTISGKDPTPTVYPTGIPTARQGDMYLNKTEGAIYQCTLGGPDIVAKWAYVMTLTGGGSGGTNDYVDLDNKPQINGVTLLGNKSASDLGVQTALTAGFGINLTTAGAISAKLLAGANVTLTNKPDGSIEIAATGGGGGATTLGGLSDVSLTSPTQGQYLVYDGSEWVNAAPDKSLARFGGSLTFSQLTSALLVAANEDKFYLCTDGGTISSGDAANWILPAGSVIPPDSHIAVVNTGTEANPVYKFDDFGGYVDLSGLAEKSELDAWKTPAATVSSGQVTFTGLDDTQGWGFEFYANITGTSVNLNPYCKVLSITGAGTSNMSLTCETDADEGSTIKVRIIK